MDQNLTPWQKYKKKAQEMKEAQGEARPWHLLNKDNYTTDAIAELRFNICKGCEFLIKPTTQCTKCGCIMSAKTKLKVAECPVGKWGKVED